MLKRFHVYAGVDVVAVCLLESFFDFCGDLVSLT